MIFQHFYLFSSRTVAENIQYPLEISNQMSEQRVEELLSLVGLMHWKDAYPAALSGGEKQRVGIARALANHPQVLICDEATSALDPKTTREILSLLKKLNEKLGLTIVLITHEMDVIKQICNKVAVIDKGEIVETGDVSKVFTDPQHEITKNFLQNRTHEIPAHFFKERSANVKLLRLSFKGEKAREPVITQMVRNYNVDANILLGWIDSVQNVMVGNLVLELSGTPDNIEKALQFLKNNAVHIEVLEKHD